MNEEKIVKTENDTERVQKVASDGVKKMSKNLKQQIWLAVIFTVVGFVNLAVYLPLCSAGVVQMRDMWWLFMFGFIACVWLPLIVQFIFKMQWSFGVVLIFDVYVLCGILIGSMWNVYSMGFYFDKIVHVVGGAMWAVLPFDFIQNSNQEKNHLSTGWLAILLISFSMMCGGVWEIYEYVSDGLLGGNAQYSNGLIGREALADTMQDLICDLVGAIIAAACILLYIYLKKKKEKTSEEKSEA